jgi:hypothetical protein
MDNQFSTKPKKISWAKQSYFRFLASNQERDEIKELAYLLNVSQSEAVRQAVSDKLDNILNSAQL